MATIKLTDDTWLAQEAAKVEGVLRSSRALGGKTGQVGRDINELKAILNYAGLDYTPAQLTTIKDKLVADGIIEVI